MCVCERDPVCAGVCESERERERVCAFVHACLSVCECKIVFVLEGYNMFVCLSSILVRERLCVHGCGLVHIHFHINFYSNFYFCFFLNFHSYFFINLLILTSILLLISILIFILISILILILIFIFFFFDRI